MSKKKVSCWFIIPLVVYPFDVLVSIGQDDVTLGKVLDRYSLSEEDILNCRYASDRARGRYARFSNGGSFIRIRNIPKTSEEFGTLAHEIAHVVYGVMDMIGMKLEQGISDEAYTYLTGYLTEKIYDKINKYY